MSILLSSCQKGIIQRDLMEFWALDSVYLIHENRNILPEYSANLLSFSKNGITHPYYQSRFTPELNACTYELIKEKKWLMKVNSPDYYFGRLFNIEIFIDQNGKRLRMVNDSLIISAHVTNSIQL